MYAGIIQISTYQSIGIGTQETSTNADYLAIAISMSNKVSFIFELEISSSASNLAIVAG